MKRFPLIAGQSHMGVDRSDIYPDVRCFTVEGYQIFYFVRRDYIEFVHIVNSPRTKYLKQLFSK